MANVKWHKKIGAILLAGLLSGTILPLPAAAEPASGTEPGITLRIHSYVRERRPSSAVVIGGGFIGVETAENLCELGLQVTLLPYL